MQPDAILLVEVTSTTLVVVVFTVTAAVAGIAIVAIVVPYVRRPVPITVPDAPVVRQVIDTSSVHCTFVKETVGVVAADVHIVTEPSFAISVTVPGDATVVNVPVKYILSVLPGVKKFVGNVLLFVFHDYSL